MILQSERRYEVAKARMMINKELQHTGNWEVKDMKEKV